MASMISHQKIDQHSFIGLREQLIYSQKKDYVWQLDKTEGLVPYEESVRRIITFLVILSGISLVACTIMTIIVATSFAKETLELDILIQEQESSKKIQNIGT